jgi:hypothetical protein
MATVTANDASPPRFDLGTLLGQSATLARSRWRALALVSALGLAPRLALEALDEGHGVASRVLPVFAAHAADRLGAALVAHVTEAMLLAICLAPVRPGAVADASRAVLRASPVLVLAWLVCESDTMLRLWNDWTQRFTLTGYLAPLGLIALDIGAGAALVAVIGLFSPVVVFERAGVADLRVALARVWRLMQGARAPGRALPRDERRADVRGAAARLSRTADHRGRPRARPALAQRHGPRPLRADQLQLERLHRRRLPRTAPPARRRAARADRRDLRLSIAGTL